jgi:hypothetical protein
MRILIRYPDEHRSFVAQSNCGIDVSGAPRRDVARNQSNHTQQHGVARSKLVATRRLRNPFEMNLKPA